MRAVFCALFTVITYLCLPLAVERGIGEVMLIAMIISFFGFVYYTGPATVRAVSCNAKLRAKLGPNRIWFSKLVKRDNSFYPCPKCGGEVMTTTFGGLMPMTDDPQCQKCETKFTLYKKWLIFRMFAY